MTNLLRILFFAASVAALGVIAGAQVSVPNTFQAGTVISAEQVNANFAALATSINQLSGSGVASINSQTGDLTVAAGANITIDNSQTGKIIISAAGTGSGGSYQAGTGLNLSGTTFGIDPSYFDSHYVSEGDVTWSNLDGIPSDLADGDDQIRITDYFEEGSLPANGTGSECTLGDVWLTAGSVSSGTRAEGQLLAISQNSTLFSLLGATYGGDGRNTFALPDLSHLAPKSLNGGSVHYVICTAGIYPSRD